MPRVDDPRLGFSGYPDHTVSCSLAEWDVASRPFWGDNQELYAAGTFRAIACGEVALGG